MSFQENDRPGTRTVLTGLLRRYPQSASARKAEEVLKELPEGDRP